MNRIKKLYIGLAAVFLIVFLLFFYEEDSALEQKDYIMVLRFDYLNGQRTVAYEAPNLEKDESDAILEQPQQVKQAEIKHYQDMDAQYKKISGREADFNHVKALLIGKGLLNDKEEFIRFLDFINEQKEFTENVLIFIDDTDTGLLKEESESVGAYLENLSGENTKKNPSQAMTAVDLLSSYYNDNKTIFLPMINGEWEIGGYACVSQGGMVNHITLDDAEWVLLGNGEIPEQEICFQDLYSETLEKEQDFCVQIDRVTREVSYEQPDDRVQATCRIVVSGKVTDSDGGKVTDAVARRSYADLFSVCLQEKLQGISDKMQTLDLFNTYYELSNKNRALWKQYRRDYQGYKEKLSLELYVDAKLTE